MALPQDKRPYVARYPSSWCVRQLSPLRNVSEGGRGRGAGPPRSRASTSADLSCLSWDHLHCFSLPVTGALQTAWLCACGGHQNSLKTLAEGKTTRERNRGASKVQASHGWQELARWHCKHRTSHGRWQLLPVAAITAAEPKEPAQIPNLRYSGISASLAGTLCGEAERVVTAPGKQDWGDKTRTGAQKMQQSWRSCICLAKMASGTYSIPQT